MNYKQEVKKMYPRATWRFTLVSRRYDKEYVNILRFWIDLNNNHYYMYPSAKNLDLAWKQAYESIENKFFDKLAE